MDEVWKPIKKLQVDVEKRGSTSKEVMTDQIRKNKKSRIWRTSIYVIYIHPQPGLNTSIWF